MRDLAGGAGFGDGICLIPNPTVGGPRDPCRPLSEYHIQPCKETRVFIAK